MTGLPAAARGVRLVVSDIDGTLVRDDKRMSGRTVEAIGRVRRAGVAFTVISARPPTGLVELAGLAGIAAEPIGAFNGGALSLADGSVIASHRVPREAASRALRMLGEAGGVTVWVFADGRWLTRAVGTPHDDRERIASGLEPEVVEGFDAVLDRIDKISGVSDDHPLMERLEREIGAAVGTQATVMRSQSYFLDVTALAANKGDGVAFIAERMGVPLQAVAALGDMPNDVPMLRRVGLPVAMGQAPEAVRSHAAHVTATNEEDGVAVFLEALAALHGG